MRNNETATIRNTRPGRSGLMPAAIMGLLILVTMTSGQSLAQTGNAAVDLDATAVPEGAAWARIRHLEGEFTLYQNDVSDADAGGINAPVLPGDILETSYDGRLEIQLANGSVVWLDHGTRLSVLTLADGRSRFENQTLFSLESGSLMIQVEPFSSDEELFRIDTEAATIYLLEEGLYRMEAGAGGGTRVTSRRGVGEVLAAEQSMLVRSGEGVFTAAGHPPGTPRIVRVMNEDAFDVFVSDRRQVFLSTGAASYAAYNEEIPVEVQPYLVEMDSHGTWNRHPSYGAIWVPRVSAGWRPYTYGYWHRRPAGNVWVSHDPWGYAPYHYGRWEYLPAYGWSWMPGGLYSPAWVSWGYSGRHVGWSPVGWYNYPSGWSISISFGVFNTSYWNFVDYSHFHHHHVNRVVVKEQYLAHDMTYAARPPRMDRASADGPRARREEAIFTQARAEARRAPVNKVAGRHAQGTQRQSFRQQEVQVTARQRGRERVDLPATARTSAPARRSVPVTARVKGPDQGRSTSARREPATRQVETREPRKILTATRTRRTAGNAGSTTTSRGTTQTNRGTSRPQVDRSRTSSRPQADRSRSSQPSPQNAPQVRNSSRSSSPRPAAPSRGSTASRPSRQSTSPSSAHKPARERTGSSVKATPSPSSTRSKPVARPSRTAARTRSTASSPATNSRSRSAARASSTTTRSRPSATPSSAAPRSSSTGKSSREASGRAAAPRRAAPSPPSGRDSRSADSGRQARDKGSDKGRRR
jgi:hypothetical protein